MARHLKRPVLLWFVALVLLGPGASADTYVDIPGTRVSLVAPEKFELSRDFAGIGWRDAAASVHVVELQAAAEEMKASFTRSQLASKGMALLRSENVESTIGPALFLHVSQAAQGVEFRKWMLIAGTSKETVLLTATAPATLADDLSEPLRRCLLTARWDPQRTVDPIAGVGFSVAETQDLKIANSVMGSALLLTKGGVQTTASPEDPFIVIARSTADVAISDLPAFSKRRLGETNKISSPVVEHEAESVIGGMPAYELVASAVAEGPVPVTVYQVVAYDGHHYFLIQGRVGVDAKDRYIEQFRQVARSLSVKQ
jgi:hypothetical protein